MKRGALLSAYVSAGMEVRFFGFSLFLVPLTMITHFFCYFPHFGNHIQPFFLLLKSRHMKFFPTQTFASPSSYLTAFMNFKIQDTFTVI